MDIDKKLKTVDYERVKLYLDLLDKIFLQYLVSKFLDKEEIQQVVLFWEKSLKSITNLESNTRNDFLMQNPLGKLLSSVSDKVEDGESLRLKAIEAMNLAKEIAEKSYHSNNFDLE